MSEIKKPVLKKTTYKIPHDLKIEMLTAVTRDGYGLKGKSKWIKTAIQALLEDDPELKTVGIGDALTKNNSVDVVNLPKDIKDQLMDGIYTLRRRDPLWEGVQGALIRAAIKHQLKKSGHRK